MWTLPQDEWPEPTTHQTQTSTGKWHIMNILKRSHIKILYLIPSLEFVHHLSQHFTSGPIVQIRFNMQSAETISQRFKKEGVRTETKGLLFGVVIYTAIVVIEWRFTWVTHTDRKQVKQTEVNKDGERKREIDKEREREKVNIKRGHVSRHK